MDKESYLIRFKTQKRANQWMERFIYKFLHEGILKVSRVASSVEFSDAIYYFRSEQGFIRGLRGLHNLTEFPEEAIYIIVDDLERTRLDTYEGV